MQWYGQISEFWKWGKLSTWLLFEFDRGEPMGSQQVEHYNSQVWREQGEPASRALQQSSLERTRGASKESITTVKSGENKGSQQVEHYNSQVWREQERKREFGWLQNKDTDGLNRSIWSPGMQGDGVCSTVSSVRQAGCQKWHQGYKLHCKMGCHRNPHNVKINSRSRAYQKNICFIVIEMRNLVPCTWKNEENWNILTD